VVPLVATTAGYVIRAQAVAVPVGVPTGVAAGVGADLPGPASGMGSLAFGAPVAEPAPAPSDFDFGQPVEAPTASAEPVSLEAPSQDALDLGAVPVAETAVQPSEAPKRAKKPKKARRVGTGRRIVHLLVLLVLTAAGAAAGEYATMVGWLGPLAVHPAVEPVRLGIIGGLLGLLVAWAGIRWTTPKS
jgi:hypothetical protein